MPARRPRRRSRPGRRRAPSRTPAPWRRPASGRRARRSGRPSARRPPGSAAAPARRRRLGGTRTASVPLLAVELRGGLRDRVGAASASATRSAHGRTPVERTDCGGRGRGAGRGEHLGGDLHDLGRGAVVDGQLLQPPAAAEVRGRAPRAQLARRPASRSARRRRPRVIDRVGQRRSSSRQAIAESSCASSTITCP